MSKFKNFGKKIAAGTTLALASAASFAADHSTLISGAGTDGNTNVTAAVTVLLTIAAILTGVGVVYALLTRK